MSGTIPEMVRLHLTFPQHLIDEPVLWRFSQELDVPFSIARANVDASAAWVILELECDEEQAEAALVWFEARGIQAGRLPQEESR